ncbi:hypothetical protein Mco01_65350 [Microbispora corallina]|uniref:MFS transporter n=1 Tax=Microbispora corallina TaxID=83302 RepID=A0ABQ4G912_9ACTN|nr:DUF6412 domain-containing protein [Microbispora corallina]GIH43535.1 hypothetical protein Mco01_65350 [Microbispora corallina]
MNVLQAALGSPAWLLAEVLAGSPGLGVATALGLTGVAVLVLAWMMLAGPARTSAVEPPSARRTGRGAPVFVRLCDPDTAGRPRPRAPSGSPAPA